MSSRSARSSGGGSRRSPPEPLLGRSGHAREGVAEGPDLVEVRRVELVGRGCVGEEAGGGIDVTVQFVDGEVVVAFEERVVSDALEVERSIGQDTYVLASRPWKMASGKPAAAPPATCDLR
jgi:hypothetical protein